MFMARRLFFWYTVLGEPYSGPGKIVFLSCQKEEAGAGNGIFDPYCGVGYSVWQLAFLGRIIPECGGYGQHMQVEQKDV